MFFISERKLKTEGFALLSSNKKIHHLCDGLFALSDPDKITNGFLLASRLKMKVHQRWPTPMFFISERNLKTEGFALLHQ